MFRRIINRKYNRGEGNIFSTKDRICSKEGRFFSCYDDNNDDYNIHILLGLRKKKINGKCVWEQKLLAASKRSAFNNPERYSKIYRANLYNKEDDNIVWELDKKFDSSESVEYDELDWNDNLIGFDKIDWNYYGLTSSFEKIKPQKFKRFYTEGNIRENDELFYVLIDDEVFGKLSKYYDDGRTRWNEDFIRGDNSDIRFGHKTYMSYLSAREVMGWLDGDYDNILFIDQDEWDRNYS